MMLQAMCLTHTRKKLGKFDSEKGKPIVAYLKEKAWQEDKNGISAVYFVKSSDGIPCMYFAIKCGALFQPLDEEEIKKEYAVAKQKVQNLKTQTGGNPKYAFLFAADSTPDGNLTNYYNTQLKFQKLLEVGTSKPFYDFCCEFMSQEIADMEKNKEAFFDNFNPDPNDIIA